MKEVKKMAEEDMYGNKKKYENLVNLGDLNYVTYFATLIVILTLPCQR